MRTIYRSLHFAGENLLQTTSSLDWICQFGSGGRAAVAIANLINSTAVECLTPHAAKSGNVTVEVSPNQQQFTTSGVLFEYQDQFEVATISPRQVRAGREMQGDAGRYREKQGDRGRYKEIQGDTGS